MPTYTKINGAQTELTSWYTKIDGVQTEMNELYSKVEGVNQLIFSKGTKLSELNISDEFYVAERDSNGILQNKIWKVALHNSNGSTLIHRKFLIDLSTVGQGSVGAKIVLRKEGYDYSDSKNIGPVMDLMNNIVQGIQIYTQTISVYGSSGSSTVSTEKKCYLGEQADFVDLPYADRMGFLEHDPNTAVSHATRTVNSGALSRRLWYITESGGLTTSSGNYSIYSGNSSTYAKVWANVPSNTIIETP